MSPPLVGVEGEGPPPITHSSQQQQQQQADQEEGVLKEHNYFSVSDSSSVDSSSSLCFSHHSHDKLNLKATELRLGLPGSQSPTRDTDPNPNHLSLDEKPLFPLSPSLSSSTGTKRPYSHTLHTTPWLFHPSNPTSQLNAPLSSSTPPKSLPPINHPAPPPPPKPLQDPSNTNAPAPKAQVVGWPPIRSFRKNTLSTTSKNTEPLFVKVSMDGAPYLRKVDLTTYTTYHQLSSALEKMFTSFTLGQCGTHKASGRDNLTETKLKDLLNGSEYVLTYEDKDGDWMLVGDVPWEMFIETCKRLKIMKSCDAIGLAPRAMEKSKTRS